MLMDLASLSWDDGIASTMGVPTSMLPEIRPSSEVRTARSARAAAPGRADRRRPRRPAGGDVRPDVLRAGEAKNTYGTGNFLLLNTGTEPVQSKSGLITTVGYKIGDQSPSTAWRARSRSPARWCSGCATT